MNKKSIGVKNLKLGEIKPDGIETVEDLKAYAINFNEQKRQELETNQEQNNVEEPV